MRVKSEMMKDLTFDQLIAVKAWIESKATKWSDKFSTNEAHDRGAEKLNLLLRVIDERLEAIVETYFEN